MREALAVWRGEPFADVAFEAFAQPEIARLQELHLSAIEDRVEADLAIGRHHELSPSSSGWWPSNPCAKGFARS